MRAVVSPDALKFDHWHCRDGRLPLAVADAMLKRIRLTDFKSFVDEQVQLAPLTLLVGANASGKSNLLDAIRFLEGVNADLSLDEVLNGEEHQGPGAWIGIRGSAAEASRFGKSRFSIESEWRALPSLESEPSSGNVALDVTHRISCQAAPRVQLISENFADESGRVLFTTTAGRDGIDDSEERPFLKLQDRNMYVPWSERSTLWALRTRRGAFAFEGAVSHVLALSTALSHIRFLDMKPQAMRDYGRKSQELGDQGRNISGFLAALCADAEQKQTLVDWLSEFCAPELVDIGFIEVERLQDFMAELVEKDGKRISFRSVSDGTLRFLGMLVALRTAPPGSVILLEELEEGLHPTRIRLLIEYLQTVTRERDLQVIATTHSPVVLQWLSTETLHNAVVCGRVPDHEGTLMRRLGDLPHIDEVLQRTGIGELFTTGWLEMAL